MKDLNEESMACMSKDLYNKKKRMISLKLSKFILKIADTS